MLGVLSTVNCVYASEGTDSRVRTSGKISFYEETLESSSSIIGETNVQQPKKPSENNFPSTGEQVQSTTLIGGILILLLVLLFFLKKHRKEKQK